MSRRSTLFRSLVFAAATFGVAGLVFHWLGRDDTKQSRPREHEVSVYEAAHSQPETELEVRGFVFIDAHAGALLCSASKVVHGRPTCDGDVVNLENLDTNRLPLEHATVEEGGFDAWTDSEVVLLATSQGSGYIAVKDVLQA